ncbi:exodeoxyribonuclease VII small subunit [Ferrimonas balearica]|uniref:exodeoxyribonuclease VII small subunit n=1 Tax=Ferrimonas balearica TaxID=44012 RepID=UPI001C9985BA|nr:exodeoxyribonuclease VII small subunit [Ferrimonas balearica]MBY5921450.1 exodeoxyribonuclease VII small subunit [Ferrimonas balearica]MBY5995865.1 exodeoxyribonuclease VII small subunit [Ferrimonas balearica]
MAKKPENMAFEAALAELEGIVAQLEQGEVPLEQALAQFERGIALVRASQQKLEQAQQQVQILTQDPEQPLQPFGTEDA